MTQDDPGDVTRPRQGGLWLGLWSKQRLLLLVFGVLAAAPWPTGAQPPARPAVPGRAPAGFGPPPGSDLFQAHCAWCHTAAGVNLDGGVAPRLAALQAMAPGKVFQAMTAGGKMQAQATALTDRDKRNVALFLTGKSIENSGRDDARMTSPCPDNSPLPMRLDAGPSWNGWGPDPSNARFQSPGAAGLRLRDIHNLKLKWAFGLPGGGTASSQPSVVLDRIFVGADNGAIHSLNARTGCLYWSFMADSAGRFAPVVAPITGRPGVRFAVYFPTGTGTTYALDAQDGKLLWKTQIEGLLHVSNSAALYDGKVFVPLAGTETFAAANPDYECCRSRGGVAALDANTGKLLWKSESIGEPLKRIGENAKGKAVWGASGASVWNTPTIDSKRRRVYVGTGNSYGPVAASTSDSILAFDLDSGKLVWSHQEFQGDAFMVGCGPQNAPGGACPEKLGPDWDFGGSSVIIQRLPDGRDVLLAAGKGGVALALNPDANGKILWRTQLWTDKAPGADGLVVFGGAADGTRVYYPLQQPGGGLKALDIATGKIDWSAEIHADRRGQIGPASATSGVVFTGAWDGTLRALDASDGKIIWQYDTHRDFDTVNGIPGNGGSLGSPGAVIVNGMVYVSSGYVGVQNGYSGNVVLAFGIE